jgi:hypothetical protein
VLAPEAEALVRPFRDRCDPSAAVGVPARVTLLYPFKPPDEIGSTVLDNLRRAFARFAPFPFALVSIRRCVAEVSYLVPEPAEPLSSTGVRELGLVSGPYGGKWSDIVLHLSVARPAARRVMGHKV